MSEYIPRLREQLVAAAAREQAGVRHRPRVRPRGLARVAVAATLAAALVLVVQAVDLPNDERAVTPGSGVRFLVQAAPGDDAAATAARAGEVLRARIAAAGIPRAEVSVAGDEIAVDGATQAQIDALAVPGRLWIYDWEASVLGPDGRPAPTDDAVTGGADAGRAAAVSRYEAVRRAAKASGSGPSTYWVVDDNTREVLGGPRPARDADVPPGARQVEVPGGVRVVHGDAGWFAVAGANALGNAFVADAAGMRDPATGDAIVALDFTPQGQAAFSDLTREVARRGADHALPGEDPVLAAQHLAFVLDDEIDTVPFINFQEVPDGIDGRDGAQIGGELTMDRARQIATILDSGPMPGTLQPLSG